VPVRDGPQPRPPTTTRAATPTPDPENTGKPDDPAAPISRDPGDLMSSGTMVYVDDSFASVEKLRTAIRYANQGQAQLAINAFQDIVTNYGQKLVLLNDNSYVSITDYVREKLLAMPAVKNGMYDQLFGLDARRDIDAAIENRDVATLIRMSDRYYPSTAALKGLAQAAEWYFERGEFSAAAQTWRKVLKHPLVGDRTAETLFRAALADHLAEDYAAAKDLRDRLAKEFPQATGTISGKPAKLLGTLDELISQGAWEKVALGTDEWPAFQGGPTRGLLLNTNATIGAKLWDVPLTQTASTADATPTPTMSRNGIIVNASELTALSSFPVLSNGALFVNTGNQLLSISASAGARLWAYPALPTPDQTAQPNVRSIVTTRSSAHDSVSVFGDQVFAVLPLGTPSSVSIRSNPYGPPLVPNRIVCLRREDGAELWTRNATEIKLQKEGPLTFIGSPLVTRQGVFIMARKSSDAAFVQQYLVRLDRETGLPTWACYLCSTSSMNTGAQYNIPVPTLVDDVLYVSTGQGADMAVDANVGRILWLRVLATKNTAAAGTNGAVINARIAQIQLDDGGILPSSALEPWKFNPPLIVGDKMVTTDTQTLRIYDRWNGKLLKSLHAVDLIAGSRISGTPSIDVLAGAVGSKIIFSMRNAALCFDLASLLSANPTPDWIATVSGREVGSPTGRPFLTTTGYYIPFATMLARVNLQTGKIETWGWPKDDKDQPGKPGNILVTSEQVVVVNAQEIAGYSKWETARDICLAKIKANPKDPATYLTLAEISFRTNHLDLSQENMKQAVDLANSGAAAAGQSLADTLGRLYQTNLSFGLQLFEKGDASVHEQARFYYEQCRAAARTPEQNVEWRMRLSALARAEKRPDEAAGLYSEVLADPALRIAGFREPDGVQSAGSTAERRLKEMIKENGPAIYQRFEDQAALLTQTATAAKDTAGLQKVIDSYPNSTASLGAATTLAGLYQDKQDWENARRVLWWLVPRVEGDAQAQAMAHLATTSLALKKYDSAAAWAMRGNRQFNGYSWNSGGKTITFADLKAQIVKAGGTDLEGRLPALPKDSDKKPAMEPSPMAHALAGSQLLVPVETSLALRPTNLIFVRQGSQLHIKDIKGEDVGQPANLPNDADTVLVGATHDFAVLMQAGTIIGVDLKTRATWTQTLRNAPPAPVAVAAGRTRIQVVGQQAVIINGNIIANGDITYVDENGQVIAPASTLSDPETARRAAFRILGNQPRFTSARILNGNILVLAGNQIDAYNIETGKPAWTSNGTPISANLPNGNASCFVGNEDLIVAQVDSPNGRGTTFCAFDAETGKPAKQIKLDNERTLWRALGDDGTLFVITDQSTAAYDMVSNQNGYLWRKTGVADPHFAGASVLTLDGLIVINANNEVQCLAPDSGNDRWPKPPLAPQANLDLELTANDKLASTLHSSVIGDLVVFQAADGTLAFKSPFQDSKNPHTTSDNSPQLAWKGVKFTNVPPFQSFQASDGFLVELLTGTNTTGTIRGVQVVFRDLYGGGTKARVSLPLAANDGSTIRSWQVVDDGIVFETAKASGPGNNLRGDIYFWRAKTNP
jgi:outer membrane protein assembly factor BamB